MDVLFSCNHFVVYCRGLQAIWKRSPSEAECCSEGSKVREISASASSSRVYRNVVGQNLDEVERKFEEVMADANEKNVPPLIRAVLEILQINASGLAVRLDVSPATVARWLSGTVPHIRQIREMRELIREKFAQTGQSGGVVFSGRTLGIWPFDEFFARAVHARRVYVLKNWMGFQAGMNPRIKTALKDLFSRNKDLQICYAYLQGSEAATTFKNFKAEVVHDFPHNVQSRELGHAAEPMKMLGDVFASPFILEYQDERIDVLLEVPVRVLATVDVNDLAGFATLFIELPDMQKHKLWAEWKPVLTDEFTEAAILRVTSEFSESIDTMRSAAYSIQGSSRDEFDSKSFFVVAESNGEVIGSVRLTDSSKGSPLKEWARGKYPLPVGQGVVELTRGTVHPRKRGRQIYKWMIIRALREAKGRNYKRATAAIESDFRQKSFLLSLGFKPVGELITFDDLPRRDTRAQPLICDLEQSAAQWETVEREVKDKTTRIKFASE